MDASSRRIVKKIICDCLCLLVVALPILILKLFGKPYHRGFFCNDETIAYPYKSSTVPNYALYIFGLGLPIVFMVLTERRRYGTTSDDRLTCIEGRKIPLWVSSSYKVVGVFLFGGACSQLTTDIAKYIIGRLRPHFFSVCLPNIDCSISSNENRYITDFTCTGTDSTLIRDARLSFPSGHSSFAAYCMIYLAIYVHARMKWDGSYLLKSLLQFACISICWMTGLSRVSDYKHHWTDVTAGFIIGVLSAIITTRYISNLFQEEEEEIRLPCNETTVLSSTTPVIVDVKEPPIEL